MHTLNFLIENWYTFYFHFFSAQIQTEHNIYVATLMSSFMLQHFVSLHHRA